MKKKIIIISGIVLAIALAVISFLIYKNEQERKRKLEEKRIETRYNTVFNNAYKMVNNNIDNNEYKTENKDEKLIYEYFENITKEKEKLKSINYEEFVSVNPLAKIYENPSEFIKKIEEYNTQFETKKHEIEEKVDKASFISYLKEKKCSEKGLNILEKKVSEDNLKFNNEEINNIELNNKEKLKNITDYINYLNTNKSNWYLKNNKIICKTDGVLNTIKGKNSTLNINITTEKEVKPKVATSKQIPVIMYHGVSDTTWGIANLFMKVNDFENQMKYLSDNGYETIFIEDIEKDYTGKKVVALTFDDGYIDFYTNVLPIIKKYNIKTNLYIITSTTNNSKYVNNEQIKELSNSGLVSIGSHTVSHNALATLSAEKIETELKNSKEYLENLLGKTIQTISYPTGSYNQTVINIAKKYYKYGITTKRGVQSMGNFSKYEIKRYAMYRTSGINTFKNMVGSAN